MIIVDDLTEKAYSPKEMSLTLNIGDSSLRKWCIAMEKHGYGFIRNDQNTRVFVESDLVVLRHFQNLVKHHNMQLDNAAKLIVDRFGKGAFEVSTDVVPVEKEKERRELERSNDNIFSVLTEHIKTQEEFNRELIKQLEQQQNYIKEQEKRRAERDLDRDKAWIEFVKENMQFRKQIAATQEEKKKKGFFSRLFSK